MAGPLHRHRLRLLPKQRLQRLAQLLRVGLRRDGPPELLAQPLAPERAELEQLLAGVDILWMGGH